jgi:ComF family protein
LGKAVRDFKYRRRLDLGRPLGRLLAEGVPDDMLGQADLWAPVPLHPWRLCWRGFNQALVLGRGMSARGGPALIPDLLLRRRHTRPQVGLTAAQRAANVAGVFAVRPRLRSRVGGRAVLLVDDVFTTGATVNECARALKEAGAAHVMVITLVRAGGGGHTSNARGA